MHMVIIFPFSLFMDVILGNVWSFERNNILITVTIMIIVLVNLVYTVHTLLHLCNQNIS